MTISIKRFARNSSSVIRARIFFFRHHSAPCSCKDGERVLDADLSKTDALVEVLKRFFEYQPPEFDEWERAVAEFKERLPEIGRALTDIIRREEKKNEKFAETFEQFVTLCRQSLNPNLRKEAVEEMLVQHLLTERIF